MHAHYQSMDKIRSLVIGPDTLRRSPPKEENNPSKQFAEEIGIPVKMVEEGIIAERNRMARPGVWHSEEDIAPFKQAAPIVAHIAPQKQETSSSTLARNFVGKKNNKIYRYPQRGPRVTVEAKEVARIFAELFEQITDQSPKRVESKYLDVGDIAQKYLCLKGIGTGQEEARYVYWIHAP